MPTEGQPLNGIRVMDLGWITAGAGTSALLADMGADVVKIEGPGAPDPFRFWETEDPDVDWWNRSPYFASTNHDKRSLCLDLKDPRGRQAVLHLLEEADVLVENFRRGVLASFDLEPAMLRKRFPRLVIASISSQGETGPDSGKVSYGSTLEATAGLAALTGTEETPVISGRDLNYPDQVACLFASGAIVAALIERQRTGQGSHLDLSQRELTTFLLGEEVIAAAAGNAPVRTANRDPLHPGERLVREGRKWIVRGAQGDAPVNDAAELLALPQFARSMAVRRTIDGQPVKGVPFRLAQRPLPTPRGCSPLGADNAEVLIEAGYSTEEIADLREAGIIATAPRSKNR